MTTEPPRGIKANLKRSFTNIVTPDLYDDSMKNTLSASATGASEMFLKREN
jgi:hypothetical protein